MEGQAQEMTTIRGQAKSKDQAMHSHIKSMPEEMNNMFEIVWKAESVM
jgi:hypothetical protein